MQGNVVGLVESVLVKFKDEMLACVKDMVSALCKEQVVDRNGTHHIPTPGVDEVSVPANHTSHNPDANANTIRNVLCNVSVYSTPPRAT